MSIVNFLQYFGRFESVSDNFIRTCTLKSVNFGREPNYFVIVLVMCGLFHPSEEMFFLVKLQS